MGEVYLFIFCSETEPLGSAKSARFAGSKRQQARRSVTVIQRESLLPVPQPADMPPKRREFSCLGWCSQWLSNSINNIGSQKKKCDSTLRPWECIMGSNSLLPGCIFSEHWTFYPIHKRCIQFAKEKFFPDVSRDQNIQPCWRLFIAFYLFLSVYFNIYFKRTIANLYRLSA